MNYNIIKDFNKYCLFTLLLLEITAKFYLLTTIKIYKNK